MSTLIQPRDYGMLLDLKDCYLTMGLHPAHRRYCRFRCPNGRRWQWKSLSFGSAEAPQICTKVLRPILRILKSLGVRCLMYIDDLLCLVQDPLRLAWSMALALELFQKELGLQIKVSKAQWSPSQDFTCLGLIWNTVTMHSLFDVVRTRIPQLRESCAREWRQLREWGNATSSSAAVTGLPAIRGRWRCGRANPRRCARTTTTRRR